MQIAERSFVTIHYTLTDAKGEVLDSSEGPDGGEPLSYVHGRGMIVPGLEEALAGKGEGDRVKVTVAPEGGYGPRREALVQKVARSEFPDGDLEVGMRFRSHGPGGAHIVTVAAIEDDLVTLDGNHPLAGATLNFDVQVVSVRRWRTTTNSKHKEPIAPNLLKRVFTASAPNKVWVADTTYLPVLGGFLFLVAIIDLFSRKVVGWSLGDSLDAELSGLALRRALARRRPGKGLVFHSDRGIEFAAKSFRKILGEAQTVQSMSRKGNCWDNAVAESFFSTLEFEGPDTSTWRYVSDGEPELFRFIEGYYNQKRIHSHNNYKTPNEAEFDLRNGARAA